MLKMVRLPYRLCFHGNDLIITSSYEKHRLEVFNAIQEGKIEEKMIDQAVRRILAMKLKYGIIKGESVE